MFWHPEAILSQLETVCIVTNPHNDASSKSSINNNTVYGLATKERAKLSAYQDARPVMGRPQKITKCALSHLAEITAIEISYDSRWVATASADKTCKVWTCPGLGLHAVLCGHTMSLSDCSWACSDTHLATASDDCTVQIWDVSTCSCLVVLRGHTGPVLCCEYNWTDSLIASASCDESIRIWDVSNGNCISILPAHSDPVTSVQFSRDNTMLLSASYDGACRMWDVHNGSCLRSLHCGEPIQVARFVEKSSSIVIVTLQCKFILWNMKNGKCSLCSCESTEIPVSDVSHFSANRHGVVFVSSQNGSVHMFEMRDQSLTCLKLLHAREDSRGLALATSHRNGTIIMSSFQDNTLGVWLLDM